MDAKTKAADTNGIVLGYRTAKEIADTISKEFGIGTAVFETPLCPNTARINFKQPSDGQARIIYVFLNGKNAESYATIYRGAATLLSFTGWGDSVKIMRAVLEQFGGYIISEKENAFIDPKNSSEMMDVQARMHRATNEILEKTQGIMEKATEEVKQATHKIMQRYGFGPSQNPICKLSDEVRSSILAAEHIRRNAI
jgi:hypothetical protein